MIEALAMTGVAVSVLILAVLVSLGPRRPAFVRKLEQRAPRPAGRNGERPAPRQQSRTGRRLAFAFVVASLVLGFVSWIFWIQAALVLAIDVAWRGRRSASR